MALCNYSQAVLPGALATQQLHGLVRAAEQILRILLSWWAGIDSCQEFRGTLEP